MLAFILFSLAAQEVTLHSQKGYNFLLPTYEITESQTMQSIRSSFLWLLKLPHNTMLESINSNFLALHQDCLTIINFIVIFACKFISPKCWLKTIKTVRNSFCKLISIKIWGFSTAKFSKTSTASFSQKENTVEHSTFRMTKL